MPINRDIAIGDISPIPSGVRGVPTPVREASDQLADELARLAELKADATEKKEAIEEARRSDNVAADEALRKGKAPTKPKAPQAFAEAEAAKRAVGSASRLVTEAQERYVAAAIEHADEWREAAEAEAQRAIADRERVFAELPQVELAYRTANETLERVEQIGRTPAGAVPMLDFRHRTALAPDQERALEEFKSR